MGSGTNTTADQPDTSDRPVTEPKGLPRHHRQLQQEHQQEPTVALSGKQTRKKARIYSQEFKSVSSVDSCSFFLLASNSYRRIISQNPVSGSFHCQLSHWGQLSHSQLSFDLLGKSQGPINRIL
jgi:hypothetical protein